MSEISSQIARTAMEGMSVSPLAKFRGTNEHGQTVISHPLLPTKIVEPRYYSCTLANASMHRQDGVKIPFVRGIAEVVVEASQQYLDKEIEDGNMYIAHATKDQIEKFKMDRDPRGTITEEIKAEMEPRLRAELEEELRSEYEAAMKLANDGNLIAGTDSISSRLAAVREMKKKAGDASGTMVVGTQPLAGIQTTKDIKDASAS